MHILLVNSHGADEAVGGAERYVASLAEGLLSRGHELAILAAFPNDGDGAQTTTLHAADWRASSTRRIRNHLGDLVSRPTRRLADAVRTSRPDLVHTNNLPGISTAIWEIAGRQRLPVVHSLHDYYLLCPRVTLVDAEGRPCCRQPRYCAARTRRLGRWAAAVTDVIGVSNYVLERQAHLFPDARRHVIRHPATPIDALSLPPPTALRTIGYIGSLEVTKGINELLAASEPLHRAGYRVHVAGDGRLRPAVEAAAASGTIVYHGAVADAAKTAFFAGCDLGVVPSVWPEPGGPPYVVLEWLAASRPVLTSTRGGLGERLAEFPGSIAIEPSARGLVDAVQALAGPERWSNAIASVQPGGSPGDADRWLREHEAVYDSAIESRSPR
jgi:glycosyltransferase involved in cell wall biosynthesis